jgi:hypothetical protein
LSGIAFAAKPKALAGPQGGIRHHGADRGANPAVAYGSAVNEFAVNEFAVNEFAVNEFAVNERRPETRVFRSSPSSPIARSPGRWVRWQTQIDAFA